MINNLNSLNNLGGIDISNLQQIISSQGEKIKELERLITTKASRNELNSGLNIKANLTDVMRSIDDLTHRIDTKTNEEDFVDKTYIDNIISTLNNKLYNIMSSKHSKPKFLA